MRRFCRWLPVILLLVCSTGCRSTWQDITDRLTPLPVHYRQRALQHEQAGEYHQALLAWRVSHRLDPDNSEVKKAIASLKKTISRQSQYHYHNGLKLYKAGDFTKARQAFLTVIRINPWHSPSRHYLKTSLQNPSRATYKVKRGDSFIRIATKFYEDPSKAYMIAHFNGMNPKKPLLTGTVLRLPVLDPAILLPKSNIKSLLQQAQKAYDRQAYEQVVAFTTKILDEIPGHPKARHLADEALLNTGKKLMKREQYRQALAQYKKISPKHKMRAQSIKMARLELERQDLAKKLESAQSYLDRGDFPETMDAAEEILDQHPDNAQARELLNLAGYASGKMLLEKGQEKEAIERLNKVDPEYSDTAQLLSLARARTKATAETLYRDGVKHFINEDLERAIAAWQEALNLNPDHPKARQDMENATRLLEKWRDLEKAPETVQ